MIDKKECHQVISKDIFKQCLLGEWLIEDPYALIGHVRFCEGLLRPEPLIAKNMMKGSEKSRQSLLDVECIILVYVMTEKIFVPFLRRWCNYMRKRTK